MRKHSVRKWLHAILALLPVIILPIFAIYSHRHTIDSYEVTVPQNMAVNFNQLIANPKPVNTNDYIIEFDSYDVNVMDTYCEIIINNNGSMSNGQVQYPVNSLLNHKYYARVNLACSDLETLVFSYGGAYYSTYQLTATYSYYQFQSIFVGNGNDTTLRFGVFSDTYTGHFYFKWLQYFDLTEMFGVGNEPTIEQFNTWYPNDYYEYNTGTKQLLKGVNTVTYDNSDIGSQMMYSLYKPINDYFNLNNVFNFGAIYDWFELNMFNGNAPLSIFIVWNIIVYEFIMDIIFLIYSVFMFFIDFATNTLDRFTGWAKRGD